MANNISNALDKLTERLELSKTEAVTQVFAKPDNIIQSEAETIKQLLGSSVSVDSSEYSEYLNNTSVTEFKNGEELVTSIADSDTKSFINQVKDIWNANYTENLDMAASNKESRATYNLISNINDSGISSSLSTAEISATAMVSTVVDSVSSIMTNIVENGNDVVNQIPMVGDAMSGMMSNISGSIGTIIQNFGQAVSSGYNDGSTETVFGSQELTSWMKLVQAINSGSTNKKINVLNTTPLDAGSNSSQLYGTMILGCPPTFNSITDPLNRTMINSFVKDAKFLSLTPGLPKYNGSRYNHASNNILQQTQTPDEMIDYLIQNGVDKDNLTKDKRYYVFDPSFGKFYSYLETMLNTVWLKLGLGTEDNNTFNIFTFFNSLDTKDRADPKPQYQSALGFYVNPIGTVTENITSEQTSIGQEYASETNNNADTYQRLLYLTGMGTGSSAQKIALATNRTIALTQNMMTYVKDLVSGTVSGWNKGSGIIQKAIGAAIGVVSDFYRYSTEQDQGAVLQAYTAVNGMRVMYPELWRSSSYSRAMNFDFNFTSPYGDPMSIFKYVFVPFCTLLCFALPRQADDNGFVSPFLIRADLPGMGTCDLGMISNFSFVRGGAQGLFTKDGLPRSISGSFTIEDFYPFLAMTRRISFLSANPSYTSFLDSMTGFSAVYSDDSSNTGLNEYFKEMLNRVNGTSNYKDTLWNRYDVYGRSANKATLSKDPYIKFNLKPRNISWLRRS